MGCKSSKDAKPQQANRPVENTNKPQDPQPQLPEASKKYELKEEKIEKVVNYTNDHPLINRAYNQVSKAKSADLNTHCYFFGIDEEGNQKIFKFDPKDSSFSPVTIPSGLEIFNLSSVVYVSEDTIYITGGANSDITAVSKRAFLYNAKENKVTELAPMYTGRYAHCSLLHDGYLYVFGGLEVEKEPATTNTNGEAYHEEESSLQSCERYNIKDNKWEKIAGLNHARSLASCFIYENEIHVVGGYLAKTKRTPTIERYHAKENKWSIYKAKLPKGLEASFIFSPFEDSIQVIGGQGSAGHQNCNFIVDLKDDVFVALRPMNHERVLHTGFHHGDHVFIFGGDEVGTFESYNLITNEWSKQPTSANFLHLLRQFSCSQPTVNVVSSTDRPVFKGSASTDNKCFIFGDDSERFILEINFTQNFVKERPVPTILKLHAYQSIIRLPSGDYFIAGGISKDARHISSRSYTYNPETGTAKKLSKMHSKRYTFSTVFLNGSVYVLGGRSFGEDNQAVLDKCERYLMEKDAWEVTESLIGKRCSSAAFSNKNNIYILGGYKEDYERWQNIEVYSEVSKKWEVHANLLTEALEGSGLVHTKDDKVFLFGGRTDKGDIEAVYELSLENGLKEVGGLSEKRCLAKAFQFEENKFCVFGGKEHLVEVFSMAKDNSHNDALIRNVENQLKNILKKGNEADSSLLRYALA